MSEEVKESKAQTLVRMMDEVLTRAFDERQAFVILVAPFDNKLGATSIVSNVPQVDAKIMLRKQLRAMYGD